MGFGVVGSSMRYVSPYTGDNRPGGGDVKVFRAVPDWAAYLSGFDMPLRTGGALTNRSPVGSWGYLS